MAKRRDGRANNGRPSQGLTEGQVLIKGPAELIEGMREYAARHEISVREAWRKAAELLLNVSH